MKEKTMADRIFKTFYASRTNIDFAVNGFAEEKDLTIVSASVATDNAFGIYASVVFEEKQKPKKKKGGEG
jgi:hypothetical protein